MKDKKLEQRCNQFDTDLVTDLTKRIEELEDQNGELEDQVEELKKTNNDLEQQLKERE